MSERRRLKAGVEVEVDGDSVWLHVGSDAVVIGFTLPKKYGGVDLITEPIPEEPAGPKVGDERTIKELKRTIEALSRVTDGHRRDMADDIQRLHHAVHVELEDRIEALERDSHPPVRIPLGEIEARIEVLEARTANILADMPWLNPNPKEVMPDAGGSRTDDDPARDVAPPPGAEQDAPGGDEPSVEEVLGWLKDIESAFAASVTDAKMPRAAARIIRERGEEIEYLEGMSRDRWHEIREQRAKIDRLTERLTITDEKVGRAWMHPGNIRFPGFPEVRAALRAAGMIDPEVEG